MIVSMKYFQHAPLNLSRLDAADLAPVAACLDADSPAAWRDMAGRLFMVLKAQPLLSRMAPEVLAQAAVSQTYQLVRDLGGSTLYLGIGTGLRTKALKRSIVAAGRVGRSVDELSKKHGVTPSRVRQILRENMQSHPTS